MSKIDVEKQRLNSRIATTWFALLIGISFAIFFMIQAFEYLTGMNAKMILVGFIASLLAFKFQPDIERFFQKRFDKSRNKI